MRPIRAFRTLWPYIRRYRRTFWLGCLWTVLTSGIGQVVPWLLGRAVDTLRDPAHSHLLGRFCLAMVGAVFVQGIFRYRMRKDLIGASRHIEYDLRRDLFAHLLRMSPRWYDQSRTGDLMTRSTSDLEAVRSVVGPAFMYSSTTLLVVSSSLVLMSLIDPKLTLYAVGPMTLLSLVVRVLGRTVHERTLHAQAQESALAGRLQETLSGIRVVQSYVQEENELAGFRNDALELVRRQLHLVRAWGLFFPAMALIVGAGTILTLWIGGQQVVRGAMTLGQFVAFNAYLMRLTWPMISIGWVFNLLERGAASMARINAILDTPPQIADPVRPAEPGPMRGEIELSGVTFAYGEGEPVLRDIDLQVRAGETLALVGPTGSGKSTLLALVARLYDVQHGSVRVDGHDVRDVPLGWLRQGIGMVPQETFLFSDTLEANIAFGSRNGQLQEQGGDGRSDSSDAGRDDPTGEPSVGDGDGASRGRPETERPPRATDPALAAAKADPDQAAATDPALVAAAEVAQLTEAVERFPQGYATLVGERGITLSGGQKQRTAIARAVLRDPAILLLDDCLSSVDTDTEEAILQRLRQIMRSRTTLIVAHRVSTVRSADRVVVIDDGRIVESGTHAELMARGDYYAQLVRKQMLREELETDLLEENR